MGFEAAVGFVLGTWFKLYSQPTLDTRPRAPAVLKWVAVFARPLKGAASAVVSATPLTAAAAADRFSSGTKPFGVCFSASLFLRLW